VTPGRPRIAVAWAKADYLSAIEQAGADARVITPETDPVAHVIDWCDGVLLTGGADVDPEHYGDAERHPTLALEKERDAYELELARLAMSRDLPLLAICRGVQLLNVAAGGTLFQDLPSQHPSAINHSLREPPDRVAHAVSVEPGSRLSTMMVGPDADLDLMVNSRHHQAVKRVAPGFRAVAHAPDGIVEAIEKPGSAFCIGVQWHPENFWRTGTFATLFEGFVAAASKR
jgi:putative glutamine amidotransferase